MAELSASQVMGLRKKTGLPMMECKEALTACQGDETAAIEWLRKKHKGKMDARGDRETGEGRIGVYIAPSGSVGGIVELRCETAPVGKNELFVNLANSIAKHVADGNVTAPEGEAVAKQLEGAMTEVYGKLRETMRIGSCRKVTGCNLASYVHHDGKSGVLLALDAAPTDAEVGKNLAMHVAFHRPLAIDCKGVPAAEVEKVRVLALEQAKEEGKPAGVIDKIAQGRVNAFYSEVVLLEQEHARADVYGRKKVKDVLKEHGVGTVTDMVHMAVGA